MNLCTKNPVAAVTGFFVLKFCSPKFISAISSLSKSAEYSDIQRTLHAWSDSKFSVTSIKLTHLRFGMLNGVIVSAYISPASGNSLGVLPNRIS
jgi:hypothetical protein